MKIKKMVATAFAMGALALLAVANGGDKSGPHEIFSNWELTELYPEGRFDALAYLGNDIVVMGTRGKNRGHIVRSTDLGKHWERIENITKDEITCLANGKDGMAYLLTGEANFYRSSDYGKTWKWMTKISNNTNHGNYTLSYGLMVTDHGTILVSDTESSGGHIYRSTDQGKSWTDLGTVSKKALYRFERTGNGILVNGWNGSIYKSQDDGNTWKEMQHVTDTPLYATEYLGTHVTLQASEDGQIFRSQNYGESWENLGILTEAADDFVKLGTGAALLTTYRGEKNMYLSLDYGRSWENIGKVNPKVVDDWFDHVIYIDKPEKVVLIGGTNRGFAVRAEIYRNRLYSLINEKNYPGLFPSEDTVSLSGLMVGSIVDPQNLNEPEDVLVYKGYAYVPNRDGNDVAIIDISNSKQPKIVSSILHPEMLDVFGTYAEGGYFYAVSMSNQRLIVTNISDPEKPKVISTISIGGKGNFNESYDSYHTRLRKITVDDGYAYVTHSNEGRLYIIDVKDPYHPEILSYLETTDGGFAVFIDGNYAYLGGCGPGESVVVADISDKKNPKLVKRIYDEEILSCTCDFSKKGNYLYATGYGDDTFLTFDISNPKDVKLVSVYQHPYMLGPGRLVVKDNVAFVINSKNDSMCSIDISNPISPVMNYIVTDRLLDRIYGIDYEGDYIYLAGRDAKSFVVLKPKD